MRGKLIPWMVLVGWLLAVPWARADGPVGFVAAVKGEAGLERDGQTLKARIGLQVLQGDVLSTGKKSRLKVLLSDDSVLALGSLSRLELSRHLFEPARKTRITRMRLMGGAMRALVQQVVGSTTADFEVRSGTTVAGVRGTEFALLHEPEGARLVTFSGGVLWAVADAEPVVVRAGQASRLDHGKATQPAALAAADLKAVRQATDATQSPIALAWNLAPGASDRLGHGVYPNAAGGGAADRDPAGSGDDSEYRDPGDLSDTGSGSNAFQGSMGTEDDMMAGAWDLGGGWENEPVDGERGLVPVKLVVRLVDRSE